MKRPQARSARRPRAPPSSIASIADHLALRLMTGGLALGPMIRFTSRAWKAIGMRPSARFSRPSRRLRTDCSALSAAGDPTGHATISTCFAYPQAISRFDVPHTPCTAGSNSGRPDRPGGIYPLRVGVTMSMHKLTAGSGYDYLTRQVAALDATEKGHIGLASYYTERGETPGVWIGSGLDGIDGLTAGDPVTAEQMRALFDCGLHPLAELRQQQLEGPDLSPRDFQEVTQLGVPFRIVDGVVSPFRLEVARRIAAINAAAGCRPTRRCRPQIGPGCGPRWPVSFSGPSMAGTRSMLGSWRERSRKTPSRGRRQLPGMT